MNVERVNINIGGIRSPGFSGDGALIQELAGLVGCELPPDYIELLNKSDGGHPEIGSFRKLGDDTSENVFDLDSIYSLENQRVERVKDVLAGWGEVLGATNLPIGCDGGGNQLYLDLSDDPATVWFYLHDEEGERIKVANNLPEFIDGLFPNPDFI